VPFQLSSQSTTAAWAHICTQHKTDLTVYWRSSLPWILMLTTAKPPSLRLDKLEVKAAIKEKVCLEDLVIKEEASLKLLMLKIVSVWSALYRLSVFTESELCSTTVWVLLLLFLFKFYQSWTSVNINKREYYCSCCDCVSHVACSQEWLLMSLKSLKKYQAVQLAVKSFNKGSQHEAHQCSGY